MLQPMTKLLQKARKYKYAIPQPDFVHLGMAAAYLEAAARRRAPIILGFGEDYIDASEAVDLRHLVQMCEVLVSRYDVPVVLHLDHGSSYEACAKAINAGFSSVMIDGSALSFDDNVRLTKEVVDLAKISGVSVEGEIGRLKTGAGYELAEGDKQVLTDPAVASEFVKQTGVDALAVSIGTVHGEYRGKPNINIDLLCRINEAVGIPLVLHGASGTDHNTLKACVQEGITKVNIYTDLAKAINQTVKEKHERVDYVQIPEALQDIREVTVDKLSTFIDVLGSAGNA
mgnify:CR=1 FL=1